MLDDLMDIEFSSLLALDIVSVLTFLWMAFCAIRAFLGMAAGEKQSIFFPIIINFVFCGLPLLLDVAVGRPEYPDTMNGLNEPAKDHLTGFIYCLTVAFATTCFWYIGRNRDTRNRRSIASQISILKSIQFSGKQKMLFFGAFIILILPILAWITGPNPALYSTYGVGSGGPELSASFLLARDEFEHYSNILSPLTQLSIVGAVVMVAMQPQYNFKIILLVFPFLVASSWLNGKRNIPVMVVFVFLYIFWEKGWIRGKHFILSCFALMLSFILFSHFYQMQVRGLEKATSAEKYYTSSRMDLGRDHTIKMAIYAELHPERPILEYRCQSCIFYPTILIPRSFWPDKPVNYALYMSKAAIERNSLFGFEGWALTTSILDEAIANFSWLGILIGPLIVCLVCRIGDATNNSFISALTNLNATLFLAVDLSVFWPMFLLWLISVITLRLTKPQPRTIATEHFNS